MKTRIAVGMSGGVDSSVAALLLKEQGYDCIGVTMLTWEDGEKTVEDAAQVAASIGIPHYVVDFREEFRTCVMEYFAGEYLRGRTPNPCVICNRHVKWNSLLKRAGELGAEQIATGHYARVVRLPNGRYTLKVSASWAKDQTYALCMLTQEQLSRTRMPVGEYSKDEIRKIAADMGLEVADKPDSQEICFIPDHDYAGFIRDFTGKEFQPGNFVTADGKVLGRHKGIVNYTVGQRKGLGLSAGHPVFVTKICPDSNEVVIGEAEDVFTDTLLCRQLNPMGAENFSQITRATAKIRYSHKGSACQVERLEEDLVRCRFDEPVRAVTPGQAVVFYDEDIVLGGGIIV